MKLVDPYTYQEYFALDYWEKNRIIAVRILGWIEDDFIAGPTGLPLHHLSDIECAWLVVEQMRKEQWVFSLCGPADTGKPYVVQFIRDDVLGQTEAMKATEAICEAALWAKGVLVM